MVYVKRQSKHFKRQLSRNGKYKTKFKFNKDENDFQTTASSVYSKYKTNAFTYEADHQLKNWLDTEGRKRQ